MRVDSASTELRMHCTTANALIQNLDTEKSECVPK